MLVAPKVKGAPQIFSFKGGMLYSDQIIFAIKHNSYSTKIVKIFLPFSFLSNRVAIGIQCCVWGKEAAEWGIIFPPQEHENDFELQQD